MLFVLSMRRESDTSKLITGCSGTISISAVFNTELRVNYSTFPYVIEVTMIRIQLDTIEEMQVFGNLLAAMLREGDVITLDGQLGAGKTTLVQMIARALHTSQEAVSPTFSLVNIYEGDRKLNHLDLYRLESEEELESFEFEDYFYPEDSITLIEWSTRTPSYLPKQRLEMEIEVGERGDRRIILRDPAGRFEKLIERLTDEYPVN